MRLSLCNEVVFALDFPAQCALAKGLGYDGLEIAPFTLSDEPHRLPAHRRAEVRRIAEDAGLAITGLHWLLLVPEGLSITSEHRDTRMRTIEVMRGLIELCVDLGGEILVHGSPKARQIEAGQSREAALANATACFAAIAEDARMAGVTYCIEPLAQGETPLINRVEEAAAIVREIGSPAVRTMIDTCAAGQAETQPIADVIGRWLPGGEIAHVHLNDPNRRAPGPGRAAFRADSRRAAAPELCRHRLGRAVRLRAGRADRRRARDRLSQGRARRAGGAMKPRIAVLGAGIVGASIAYHLARRGAPVTLYDRGREAGQATEKSFAWINATWGNPEPYFRLRVLGMAEWRRLEDELGGALGVAWRGCLIWDLADQDLEAFASRHAAWGYDVRLVGRDEIAALEPCLIAPPERAAYAAGDGTVEPVAATRALLAAAASLGAAIRLETEVPDPRALEADVCVLATGAASSALCAKLGPGPADAPDAGPARAQQAGGAAAAPGRAGAGAAHEAGARPHRRRAGFRRRPRAERRRGGGPAPAGPGRRAACAAPRRWNSTG